MSSFAHLEDMIRPASPWDQQRPAPAWQERPAPSSNGSGRGAGFGGDPQAMSDLFSGYADAPPRLGSGPTPSGAGPSAGGTAQSLPIPKGAQGSNVESIQRALNLWVCSDGRGAGYQDSTLAVDGKYGSNTEYVVARFQSAQGLAPTGAVNAATYAALQGYGCSLILTYDTHGGGI